VVEELITRDELYIVEEVFVCGTAKEVVAANMIDHRRIGEGVVGSNTNQQFEVYKQTVRGEGVYSKEWLDYAE
jgi:branched-chain amino acid aminotransferase